MNITKFKDTQIAVHDLLIEYPNLRDSDQRLVAFFHTLEMGGVSVCKSMSAYEYLKAIVDGKLTNAESITRARRKVQENTPALRGKKYNERKLAESKVREAIKTI
jgi:hypothetical protein